MRRWTWVAAVLALSASLLPPPVAAQTPDPVGVVTTLDGRATVARAALPAPLVLKFKDDVFGRDRIRTQENSLVRVLLGGKAILTVRELSQVTISEEPGRAVVTLPSGKVVLAVAKQRMQPGESIEIRTPNAVAAVRGSILAVAHDAALGTTTAICAAGSCTYQYGTGPTGPLPVGQRALNALMTQASPAEVTEAVTVQTSAPAITSPPQSVQNTVIESQTLQATQVAQFVSTGAVGPLPPTGTGIPTLTPGSAAPVNSTSADPFTAGGVPGGTSGSTGGGTGGNGNGGGPPPPDPKPGAVEKIVNGGFETGSLPPSWTLTGGGGIVTGFGSSITPPEGQGMALIHTGAGALPVSTNLGLFPGAPTDVTEGSRLSQSFNVEGGSLFTIKVNYNFISNEFPTQQVDDIFRVRVTDPSGATKELAFESRQTSEFQNSSEVVSALGFTTSFSHGRTGPTALATQWVPETSGSATLSFDIFDRNDIAFDSGALIDAASVAQDPPLYFLRRGDVLTRAQADPLLRLTSSTQSFDSLMVVCCEGRASLAGPLLHATDSNLTVPWSVLAVLQGGALTTSSTDPLARLEGGSHSFGGAGVPMFDLYGVSAAVDPETGLTLGTHRPLQHAGSLLETSNASVSTSQAVRVDHALLEASAPLLALRNGSALVTANDTVQLSYQAKVTSLGSVMALDRSSLTVARGAALSLAGGSLLRVTGNLFSLTNGSSLNLLNGSLVSLSGGSILNVTGGLIAFGGSGGNLVSVANSFCPCTTIGGIPVSLTGGALASNVSIAGAIKGGDLGAVKLAPNAALIRVDGAGTKVTIGGL